jgi:hypothetical protein
MQQAGPIKIMKWTQFLLHDEPQVCRKINSFIFFSYKLTVPKHMGFEVFTLVRVQIVVFWAATPCKFVVG